MKLNGVEISEKEFDDYINKNKTHISTLSPFNKVLWILFSIVVAVFALIGVIATALYIF